MYMLCGCYFCMIRPQVLGVYYTPLLSAARSYLFGNPSIVGGRPLDLHKVRDAVELVISLSIYILYI